MHKWFLLKQTVNNYYSEVWQCLANCLSDSLQKLQNWAARRITYLGYEHRSIDFFNNLGWETLGQRRKKQLAVCTYKPINKLVPVGLKSLFEPISQVHAYTLRGSSNNIFIPTPEADAVVVQCYGTDLANEIKTQPSVASLTNSLRLLDFR